MIIDERYEMTKHSFILRTTVRSLWWREPRHVEHSNLLAAMAKTWKKVPLKVSMHIRVLFQDYNWTVPEIRKKYPTIPTTTIRYHAKLNAVDETGDRRKSNPGRPRILKVHDIRQLSRKVKQLRTFDDANFSAVKLRNLCGLPPCSMRTVHRAMRRDLNLRFLNTRQKGILSDADRKLRVAFCKDCVRRVGDKLWLEKISFYYDGVSFYHKSNPFAEAVTTKAKIWRKPNEGLSMTRKGKKEGNNGKKVFMFVAVAYGKGVVMCEQFDPEIKFNGKTTGNLWQNIFQIHSERVPIPGARLCYKMGILYRSLHKLILHTSELDVRYSASQRGVPTSIQLRMCSTRHAASWRRRQRQSELPENHTRRMRHAWRLPFVQLRLTSLIGRSNPCPKGWKLSLHRVGTERSIDSFELAVSYALPFVHYLKLAAVTFAAGY